jgi:hypothetical protein
MDETGFVTITLTKEESNFRRSCLHTEVPAFRLPARSRFGGGRARRRGRRTGPDDYLDIGICGAG